VFRMSFFSLADGLFSPEYGLLRNNYITVTRFYIGRDIEKPPPCYSSRGNETSVNSRLRLTTYLTHHETRIVL
jgi:hypothetical protein